MPKVLSEKEIVSIVENKTIEQCNDHEKKQVFAFMFGEDFMDADDKGEKHEYPQSDFDKLCDEWANFLKANQLPSEWDAQEAILHEITPKQRIFVSDFIERWEAL